MVSLRTFRYPEDYEALINLWGKAGEGVHLGRSDQPDELVKKVQRDPDLFLLAEKDGKIIGAVMGGFDGRRGMVYHLAVETGFRRQGIATILMEELEQRLRAKGCIRSYLLVTRDNLDAVQFYEAHGWERMDLYPYAKDLD